MRRKPSDSNIKMITGSASQPIIQALDDEPIFHVVMGACLGIFLESFQHTSRIDTFFYCWKLDILFQRALVLQIEKNLMRNALEHLSQISTISKFE